jgi:hypothetical protein
MFITKMRPKKVFGLIILGLIVALSPAAIATAVCNPEAQSCSSTYQVTESFFGSGGQFACSTGSYCAKQTAGELGVGKTCTLTYCAQAGFNTDRTPYLEFIVNTPNVDVGVLDPAETHVGTATFRVKSYLASGYQVTTESVGPKSGSHIMAAPSSPTASAAGTEQFGMNVVANTCPAATLPFSSGAKGRCPDTNGSGTLGKDPFQDPDSTFSFGQAAANYNVADSYMYQNGNIIASSSSSSGTTLYTLSYIFNISNVTPAGTYTMAQSLVATSTF